MSDSAVIDTLVIKRDELLTALQGNERGDETVLRVTAPYNPRMRARLHMKQPGDDDDPRQLLIPPDRLLYDDHPPFPKPDETADSLRATNEPFSVDRHRERHEASVEAWRAAVSSHVVDHVDVPSLADSVSVSILGSSDTE